MRTSRASSFACLTESTQRATGSLISREECTGTSSCAPSAISWSMAAGRWRSAATSIGRLPSFLKSLASFAAVVVLPEPWRPTIMMIVGGFGNNCILLLVFPRSSQSSSWTILMTCCPGVRLSRTSLPTALALMFPTKSLTTLKLTSASRRASRISFNARSTSSSFKRPLPFSFLNIDSNFSVRDSNMGRDNVPFLIQSYAVQG